MNEQGKFRPRDARMCFKTDRLLDRSNSQIMHSIPQNNAKYFAAIGGLILAEVGQPSVGKHTSDDFR
jgi:hypothetical protein